MCSLPLTIEDDAVAKLLMVHSLTKPDTHFCTLADRCSAFCGGARIGRDTWTRGLTSSIRTRREFHAIKRDGCE